METQSLDALLAWAAATLTRLGRSVGGLPSIIAHSNDAPLAIIVGNKNRLFITGGVAESQDGEWWPIVLSWDELVADWRSIGYNEHRDLVESVVVSYFSDEAGPLLLDGDPDMKQEFEMSSQIPNIAMLVAAAAAILVARRNYQPSQSENIRVFCELGAEVLHVMPKNKLMDLLMLFTRQHGRLLIPGLSNAPALPMGGGKLRPLSLAEISHPGNPKLPAWREWFTDQIVNDLVANGVVEQQFPFTAPQMFFIEGARQEFFANHAQHERYQRAQTSVSIRLLLEEARQQTAQQARKESANTDAVAALDTYLLRALRYVDAKLVATDVAMLKFNSYVGRPLNLFAEMIKANAFGADSPRNALFRDARKHDTVWVDWLYALYVLHSRVGIVHLDLHGGNVIVSHTANRAAHHVFTVPNIPVATLAEAWTGGAPRSEKSTAAKAEAAKSGNTASASARDKSKPLAAANAAPNEKTDTNPAADSDAPTLTIVTENDADDPKIMGAFIDFSRAIAFPTRRTLHFLLPDQRQEYGDTQLEQLGVSVERLLDSFAETHADLVHQARVAYRAAAAAPALQFRAASALDVASVARSVLSAAVNPSKDLLTTAASIEVGALRDFVALLTAPPTAFEDLPAAEWPALRALLRHFRHRAGAAFVSPQEVLARPAEFPDHMARVQKTDMTHPVLAFETGNGLFRLLDGAHRIARAIYEKRPTISVQYLPAAAIPQVVWRSGDAPGRVIDGVKYAVERGWALAGEPRNVPVAELLLAVAVPLWPRWLSTDALDYATPLAVDVRNPSQFAQQVRAAWKNMGATLPPPNIFSAERNKETYAILHAERAQALQQLAAQHRKVAATGTTGSWVL
jgi:hypothetical protein